MVTWQGGVLHGTVPDSPTPARPSPTAEPDPGLPVFEARGRSPRGYVTVVLDGSGHARGVRVTAGATILPAAALGEEILGALHAAERVLRDRAASAAHVVDVPEIAGPVDTGAVITAIRAASRELGADLNRMVADLRQAVETSGAFDPGQFDLDRDDDRKESQP